MWEVSREIHHLKSEISTLKSQVAQLEKGKQPLTQNIYAITTAYTLHTAPKTDESNVEIFEGKKDPTIGFREMRILAIEYQQHHVLLKNCIKGQMFTLKTLIDSRADVNVFNTKVIPTKFWVKSTRQVVRLGNKTLHYEVP